MLDFNPSEFLLVAIVALVVIGPKDLPKAMRFVGRWVGKARGVARQFRSGFDAMVREAELEEMEKRWKEENERIMREHPAELAASDGVHEPAGSQTLVVQDSADEHATPASTPPPALHEDDARPAMTPQPVVFGGLAENAAPEPPFADERAPMLDLPMPTPAPTPPPSPDKP